MQWMLGTRQAQYHYIAMYQVLLVQIMGPHYYLRIASLVHTDGATGCGYAPVGGGAARMPSASLDAHQSLTPMAVVGSESVSRSPATHIHLAPSVLVSWPSRKLGPVLSPKNASPHTLCLLPPVLLCSSLQSGTHLIEPGLFKPPRVYPGIIYQTYGQ